MAPLQWAMENLFVGNGEGGQFSSSFQFRLSSFFFVEIFQMQCRDVEEIEAPSADNEKLLLHEPPQWFNGRIHIYTPSE